MKVFFLLFNLCLCLPLMGQNQTSSQALPPVMGWSVWNPLHHDLGEDYIDRQAKALVFQGFKSVGYEYVQNGEELYKLQNVGFGLEKVPSPAYSYMADEDIFDTWHSVKEFIKKGLYRSACCKPGFYNYMGKLMIGHSLSQEEDETLFALWCMLESPLLLTCDLQNLSQATRDLMTNRELIALNQQPPFEQAYVFKESRDCYFLVKDVETKFGQKRAFAIYNSGDNEQKFWVNFEDMDLLGETAVRDLLQHADLGIKDQGMDVTIAPHATQVYLLEADERLDRVVYPYECGLTHAENNLLEFEEVYCKRGGRRRIQICYSEGEHARFQLIVNNRIVKDVNTRGNRGIITLITKLKPGVNNIRFTNANGKMPHIDSFRINKF